MSDLIKTSLSLFLIITGMMVLFYGDTTELWQKLNAIVSVTIGFVALFHTAGVIK